jgi:uncharacterized membrane protein YqgA involved in biofilm formation
MIGLGTIVNALAIVAGCIVGLFLKRGFPQKWQETIMQGITLCIFVIGCQMAFQSKNIIVVIVSIAIGTVIGEMLDIDGKLQRFGNWVEVKMVGKRNTGTAGAIGEGFIAASLIYCIGAMAILGSIQDGLTGDHQILFAKSTLDGMTAMIFTANLGVGVGLSAVSVLIYQGLITILAAHSAKFYDPGPDGGNHRYRRHPHHGDCREHEQGHADPDCQPDSGPGNRGADHEPTYHRKQKLPFACY